ncbi:hypothetical protein RI367_003988 [Sorochytrium milnesiophthora]
MATENAGGSPSRSSKFMTLTKSGMANFLRTSSMHTSHSVDTALLSLAPESPKKDDLSPSSPKAPTLAAPIPTPEVVAPKVTLKLAYRELLEVPVDKLKDAGENLAILDLSHNSIGVIPDVLAQFTKLETFVMSSNQLKNLAPALTLLSNLRQLNLSSNMITTEDIEAAQIDKLVNLQELYLSDNDIRVFPERITRLSKLQRLSLSDNRIEILPPSIAALTELLWIGLSKNRIACIDPLFALKKLKGVTIYDNPLDNPETSCYQLQHFLPVAILSSFENRDLMSMDKVKRRTMELSSEIRKELQRGGGQQSPFDKDGSSPFIARSTFSLIKKPIKGGKKPQSSLHKVLKMNSTSSLANDNSDDDSHSGGGRSRSGSTTNTVERKSSATETTNFLSPITPMSPMSLFGRRSNTRVDTLADKLAPEGANDQRRSSEDLQQMRKSREGTPAGLAM